MISSGFVRASEDSEKISSVSDFFKNHKQERQHEVKTSYTCVDAEAVDTEGRAEEANVNFISGAGFQGSGNQGGNRNSDGNRGKFQPDGERREAARRRFRNREFDEFRRIALVSIDAKPQTSVDRSHPKAIDILLWTSIDNIYVVNHFLQCREDHDSRGVRSKTPTSAQPCLCENRSTSGARHRSTSGDRHRLTTTSTHRSTSTYYVPSADAEDRCCTS
ncbi:hypothetical protein F2Q69_00009409 [Brassica cretica]|uniref:Uncharacterized protein n=1 Tax=Brassica cretica TaxID=69181 RepID=A0A8S9P6X2_BRACR|nr:hypothetical protein F2Q69_00009409 [Brassica cretica]